MSGLDEEKDVSRRVARTRDSSVRPRKRAKRKSKESTEEIAPVRKVSAPKPKVRVPESNEIRKAPTQFAEKKIGRTRKRNKYTVIFALLVLGIGSSAAVGFMDEGRIDVQETIEARNERIRNNQMTEADSVITSTVVPVQNTNSERKVDGGLVGLGTGGAAPKPALVPVATTTASSSDEVASSTNEVNEEVESVEEPESNEEEISSLETTAETTVTE